MFLSRFFRKHPASFEISSPKIVITKSMTENFKQLKEHNIPYEKVTTGYICFNGKVFDDKLDMVIGLHYKLNLLEHIELFRPKEYYNENYDIDASFLEIHECMKEIYGKPTFQHIKKTDKYGNGSSAYWNFNNLKIKHSIWEHFGPTESLTIQII